MNTKGQNLDTVCAKLVDAIIADNIFERGKLLEKTRVILQAWLRVYDRPWNYDNIKTDKGILQRTIEKKDIELKFWREHLKKSIGNEKIKIHYKELDDVLESAGFENGQLKHNKTQPLSKTSKQ